MRQARENAYQRGYDEVVGSWTRSGPDTQGLTNFPSGPFPATSDSERRSFKRKNVTSFPFFNLRGTRVLGDHSRYLSWSPSPSWRAAHVHNICDQLHKTYEIRGRRYALMSIGWGNGVIAGISLAVSVSTYVIHVYRAKS